MPPKTEGSSSKPAERFTLTGPSLILDPKIHAYRSDIADVALAGQLFAPHYARPLTRLIGKAAELREGPSPDALLIADLAPGEEFAWIETTGTWAWGYRRADHRVGYVRADALGPIA